MSGGRRASLAVGVLLILIGGGFLAIQLVPGLQAWVDILSWPVLIIILGVLFLVFGILSGVSALAVPACIIGGIGVVIYWQNATGNWTSWVYTWTLIPGFVGLGIILWGLLGRRFRQGISVGGPLIVISLVMFAVFGGVFGSLGWLWPYWPLVLVAVGLLIIVQIFLRSR